MNFNLALISALNLIRNNSSNGLYTTDKIKSKNPHIAATTLILIATLATMGLLLPHIGFIALAIPGGGIPLGSGAIYAHYRKFINPSIETQRNIENYYHQLEGTGQKQPSEIIVDDLKRLPVGQGYLPTRIRGHESLSSQFLEKREKKLINGRFLAEDENLKDRLIEDDTYIKERGWTHQKLAAPLMAALLETRDYHPIENPLVEKLFSLGCGDFKVTRQAIFKEEPGKAYPFEEETIGQEGSSIIVLENLRTGETLNFFDFLPLMIWKYGFYGGKTPFRLEPSNIMAFLQEEELGEENLLRKYQSHHLDEFNFNWLEAWSETAKYIFQDKLIMMTQNRLEMGEFKLFLQERPLLAANYREKAEKFGLIPSREILTFIPVQSPGDCFGSVTHFFYLILSQNMTPEEAASQFERGVPREAVYKQKLTQNFKRVPEFSSMFNNHGTEDLSPPLAEIQFGLDLSDLVIEKFVRDRSTAEDVIGSFDSGLEPGFYLFTLPILNGYGEFIDYHETGLIINKEGPCYIFDPNYGISKFPKEGQEISDTVIRLLLSYNHTSKTISNQKECRLLKLSPYFSPL